MLQSTLSTLQAGTRYVLCLIYTVWTNIDVHKQLIGRTIPCFDYLGYKSGFSIEQPWLYQDFDLLDFYRVSEDELNKQLNLFRSGMYKFEWKDEEFDMAEHNKFLNEVDDEVKDIRSKQRKVQEEMITAEKESLAKWREDMQKNKVDESTVDALLAGESLPIP